MAVVVVEVAAKGFEAVEVAVGSGFGTGMSFRMVGMATRSKGF